MQCAAAPSQAPAPPTRDTKCGVECGGVQPPVAERVRLAGLRKTALVLDGLFSAPECEGLITESYQPCHGGYKRLYSNSKSGLEAGCCAAGATVAKVEFESKVVHQLWSRLAPFLPKRCVPGCPDWDGVGVWVPRTGGWGCVTCASGAGWACWGESVPPRR